MGPFGSVLLAAGRGVRLRPLTDVLPKAAMPILDVPLAAHCLARLVPAAAPVAINVSHLGNKLAEQLGEHFPAEAITFIDEGSTPPGSGGTLAALTPGFGPRVVTHNSDVLTDLDPAQLLATHERLGASATVAVIAVATAADFELEGHRVVRFLDRKSEATTPGARFMGIAVFEKSSLTLIPEPRPIDLARALLLPLAANGDLAVHVHGGYWLDVGTPAHYLQASLDALSGDARATIKPPGEVRAVPGGTAYVGPGARVEESSIGPGALVLRGAALGPGSRIDHSVVWPHEQIPPEVRLEHCVWIGGRRVDASV